MIDLEELNDIELEDLVEKLIPFIRKKLSFESTQSFLDKQTEMEQIKTIEFESNGREQVFDNPLHKPIEGIWITYGDENASVKMTNNTPNKITLDSGLIPLGAKVRVLLY